MFVKGILYSMLEFWLIISFWLFSVEVGKCLALIWVS